MQMYFGAQWHSAGKSIPVTNPFDGSVIDTVPEGTVADIEQAITGLQRGAAEMAQLTGYERSQILRKAAQLMAEREQELGTLISREEGKILAEGLLEANRAREVMEVSAEEAKRVTGEMVPLESAPGVKRTLGFTLRVPCGIVAAITPFNFPLNLVCHKVGPALAAGNAVLIKPASDTPLSALKLVEILLEAGLPPTAIACVTGGGKMLGEAICRDPRVRKISFTGSLQVGEQICRWAGLKRVTMELGSNCPVIIMDDANLDQAAAAVAASGFANSGQTCISAQRILTDRRIQRDFLDALRPLVAALPVGDQLDKATKVGPMIRESDAERVETWISEAVGSGARVMVGGHRRGALHEPTIVTDVTPDMRISREELFGPAVAVTSFEDLDEAIALANGSDYGLAAGIFTRDLDRAMQFALRVESGNLHINSSSQWRADLMPYGGLKGSGMGKEGPKYAIQAMTEEKLVAIHL